MLDDADSSIPAAFRVVRPFMVPIPGARHWLFGLASEVGGEVPCSLRFSWDTLDMLSCIIADEPKDEPSDLSKVLDTVVEAEP
jgi:hypothetical protein